MILNSILLAVVAVFLGVYGWAYSLSNKVSRRKSADLHNLILLAFIGFLALVGAGTIAISLISVLKALYTWLTL